MASRPRRSAAQKASAAITDIADLDATPASERTRSRRSTNGIGDESVTSNGNTTAYFKSKMPGSKLRQSTSVSDAQIADGKPARAARGGRKSYVVESDSDEDAVGEDIDGDDMDEDAPGEEVDDMDVDAEGEFLQEDVDVGDYNKPPAPPISRMPPPILPSAARPPPPKPAIKASSSKARPVLDDDDEEEDEELSDLESDNGVDDTMGPGDDEDAEGEEIEDDLDAEGEEIEDEGDEDAEGELDSDDDTPGGTERDGTPDLAKMTSRQRARFEEPDPNQYQALSNDVQAKKVFTAEEIGMRRQEMARRRRNLSEKRNEEIKMETINKLLKKQPQKAKRGAGQTAGDETPADAEPAKPNPVFIRYISNREGSRVAVPEEIYDGPLGRAFKPAVAKALPPVSRGPRKLIEEVS